MGGIITEGVGAAYPKGDIGWMEKCKEGLEVLKGGVAAWADADNEGLFVKKGYAIKAWTIIGIYEGKIVFSDGNYVLELDNGKGRDGGSYDIWENKWRAHKENYWTNKPNQKNLWNNL